MKRAVESLGLDLAIVKTGGGARLGFLRLATAFASPWKAGGGGDDRGTQSGCQ